MTRGMLTTTRGRMCACRRRGRAVLRRIAVIFIAVSLPAILRCTPDFNPFADRSNARAVLSSVSFNNGDTLEIFCRETLDVMVAVREQIDTIILHVGGNRLFGIDTVIFTAGGAANAARYRFIVSLYDTGRQRIEVRSLRKGGESVSDAWDVYVESPLSQTVVEGVFDSTVRLRTDPVADDDVLYHWDFGRGVPLQSPWPETLAVIHDAGYSQTGYLWVSDISGVYVSPRVPFSFVFADTKGPAIVCVNEGYEGRDTVMTGGTLFPFKVRITDRGRGGVAAARINAESFDIVDDPLYIKIFDNCDRIAGLREITVSAVDNDQDKNVSEKRFWLGYDPAQAHRGEVRIGIIVPSRDSTISFVRQRPLLGTVENYTGDSLRIQISVNDSSYQRGNLGNDFTAYWNQTVYLVQQSNLVAIVVYDINGAALDDTTITILFDSTRQDSAAPTIFEISVDGKPAAGMYAEDDSVTVRVIAFDEGSGIASVIFNGAAVTAASGGGSVWDVPVALSHGSSGNTITVSAVDNAGLRRDTTVVLFQNRPPRILVPASPPYPLVAGETWRDTVTATDADGDTVRFEKVSGPVGMTVGANGAIAWTPAAAAVGTHAVSIAARDNVSSTLYAFSVTVVDSSFYGSAVTFSITEQAFPRFVEAGVDTVRVILSISAGSGTGPFGYSAIRRVGTSQEIIPLTGNEFVWAPAAADTGYQRFVIAVKDKYGRADTLYPVILVVPPNRPCGLSYTFSGDTLAGGVLDFTGGGVDTVFFQIVDPDRTEVERFTVEIKYAGAQDIRAIEGGDSFTVIIDPASALRPADTLSVSVEDRAGHTAEAVVPMKFSP